MVRTDYVATRYTFFLYPLCLIGLIVPLAFVLDRVRRTAAQWAAGVAAVAIFFGISSDHDVAELTKVGTYEHVFRLNMPDARAHQLYKRYDYPSAGRFLANQASDADRIMLTHPGQSSGVDRFDFVYRSNPVEYQRTRCSSGIDQWTGKPLLGTKEQLLAVAGELGADEALWLVDYVKDPVFTPEEMAALGPSLASEAVYQTPDRQLQVIRIARSGSPASGPGNAPSEPVVSDLGEVSSAL